MKPTTFVFAALAGSVAAQYYNVSSNAFRLFIKSDNSSIDGVALGACHAGAAIESLCLTSEKRNDTASTYTTFYHNVSASDEPNAIDTAGVLAYVLRAGGGLEVPSSMQLSNQLTSNVAVPVISPGWDDYTAVYFDEYGSLYIPAYQDDTVSPPESFPGTMRIKNWYVCLTRYTYTYTTLAWKVGLTGEPQNPSCQKVEVERVWV